jgi:Capsule assembly protein Wzi
MSNVLFAASPALQHTPGSLPRLGRVLIAFGLISLPLVTPRTSTAQSAGGRSEIVVGSQLESYLRYLQTAGKSEEYPWGIRSFSPSEIDKLAAKDSAHPWAKRYDLQQRQHSGFEWDYIRPRLTTYVNTVFPYGGNDGAVWQGKGLTTAFQGGVSARWRAFSAAIAPIAFRAENQSFPLMRNGETGRLAFADGEFPNYVDLPQRFGTDPYGRFDMGQSFLRVDAFGVTAGWSTENMWWGPTDKYPFIIGNNAAGFPHIFFGTSQPVNIFIGKVHTRLVYGQLDQSSYSPETGPKYFRSFEQAGRVRFMAGLVGTFEPRGIPGLEVGGGRFFHAASDSLGYWFSKYNLKLPLQTFLKQGLPQESQKPVQGGTQAIKENQLASAFIRWAPPGSGFEVYGEMGREDHSLNARDFILEPDHSATGNVGFRKAWFSPTVINAVRAEVFSFEAAAGSRVRGEGQTYIHGVLRQGHTERGQVIGANVGPGSGSAESFSYDRFTANGSFTAFVTREVQHELRGFQTGRPVPKAVDVMNSIGAEATRFFGPLDVTARITLTDDINRYFLANVQNANFMLSIRQNF